jgi:TRAP-type mannitol/chloroaromatic compound transport system permease small subunit
MREAMPTVWAPPYYTMKFLVPLGAFLLIMQGVAEVFKRLEIFRGWRKEA